MQLNRQAPFAQTFGPDFANGLAFFQDGLYFKADGSLNETLAANLEALKKREKTVTVAAVESQPKPKDELDSRSVSEVFQMAQKIAEVIAEAGEAVDYAPTPGNKAANIAFIRAHTE